MSEMFEGVTPAENSDVTQSGESQTQQTAAIDWSKINANDIPVELLKQHPVHQQVVKESIDRRHQIKKLLDEGEKPATPEAPAAPATNDDVPAWAKAIMQRVDDIAKANSDAPVKAAKTEAIAQYGLSEDQAAFLSGSTPEEVKANAAKLAAAFNVTHTGAGAGGSDGSLDPLQALFKRTDERLEAKLDPLKAPSIFDPGMQRQKLGTTIK